MKLQERPGSKQLLSPTRDTAKATECSSFHEATAGDSLQVYGYQFKLLEPRGCFCQKQGLRAPYLTTSNSK